MSNPNYINDNGTWKNATNCYVKNNGSWVEADEGWKNVNGTWTKFYDKHTSTTTKIQVRGLDWDESNGCACSENSTYYIWEDGGGVGASLSPSVGDIINNGFECVKVTALNVTGNAVSYTVEANNDCDDCNTSLAICTEDEGGGSSSTTTSTTEGW